MVIYILPVPVPPAKPTSGPIVMLAAINNTMDLDRLDRLRSNYSDYEAGFDAGVAPTHDSNYDPAIDSHRQPKVETSFPSPDMEKYSAKYPFSIIDDTFSKISSRSPPNYMWNTFSHAHMGSSAYPSPALDLDEWIPNTTPYNFLLVDDNEINLRIFSRMLQKLYPRASVGTLQESRHLETTEAALLHFDIIFLDIEMPHVTGTDIATRVRSLSGLDHVALVAVTTRYSSRDLELYCLVGFDYTIPKPLENHNYIQRKVDLILRMRMPQ